MNSDLNSILVEGRITAAPQLSYTPKGAAVCKFSVACNRSYKAEDDEIKKEVSFFDVETWTRLAEVCAEYLKKGRGVRVVGRLKQDRWTDTDGKQHQRVKILAEHVEFKPQIKAAAPLPDEIQAASEAVEQEPQEPQQE